MTNIQPDIPDAGRYSLTEAAELLGIHRVTLFNYNKDAKIKHGIRRSNGRKFFTGSEIKRFWKAQE